MIVAEKLMGLDPTAPEMTLLLVMLHTGTMFAVILYFWKDWKQRFFGSASELKAFVQKILIATLCTGALGYGLKIVIEKGFMHGADHQEVEQLFGNLPLIATALFSAGVLIIYSSSKKFSDRPEVALNNKNSAWLGAIQGLCLPFRGFSRSGATLSAGLIAGISRRTAEEFSFALAVALTPPVILRELSRLLKHHDASQSPLDLTQLLAPSFFGMVFSFAAGLFALKWLSSWLENGKWRYFGYYCLAASLVIASLAMAGY